MYSQRCVTVTSHTNLWAGLMPTTSLLQGSTDYCICSCQFTFFPPVNTKTEGQHQDITFLLVYTLTCRPSPPQVTGVVLLSVGLWWKFMLGPYMLLISNSPSNAPYVLTGTGVAIVLFGLFGCFATCKGRPWMLKLVRLCFDVVQIITSGGGIFRSFTIYCSL